MTKEEIDKLWREGYAAKFLAIPSGDRHIASGILSSANLVGHERIRVLVEAIQLLEEEE